MLNVGKLYQIKKYSWMLYPSKEIATAPNTVTGNGTLWASSLSDAYWLDYWSNQLNCNMTYISKNSIFCLLEEDGKYLKILSTNGELGWIIYPKNEEWNKGSIEEVTQE